LNNLSEQVVKRIEKLNMILWAAVIIEVVIIVLIL
jgi:uncharacterized membrane protein YvbJ